MRSNANRILVIKMIAIIFLAGSAYAQSLSSASTRFDPSLFNALRWRNIGPDRGGRSIACAGSPSRLFEYYMGATGGGLWKSTDGGTTWKPVTDGQIHSSSVGAISIAPTNPDLVYVAAFGHHAAPNPDRGVFRSKDGGKSWEKFLFRDNKTGAIELI